jgi:hypothetical protein
MPPTRSYLLKTLNIFFYKPVDYSLNITAVKISHLLHQSSNFLKPRQKDRSNAMDLEENLADICSKLHRSATFNLYFYVIFL